MFYMINQKIDQAEKQRLAIARTLYYATWAAEQNRHFIDNNLERINRKFDKYDYQIDKLFNKQVPQGAWCDELYTCVSPGTYTVGAR